MKEEKKLNNKTPKWFIEWHYTHFKAVKDRSKRNEVLIYILLTAVLALNTVGNYFHIQIWEFILSFFD